MDRLDAMALFLGVVDAGSFARAARHSGVSPASVTRAVAMLEERLGDRLLHRSTRGLRLTEVGERQAVVYRSVLAELAEAEGTARIADRLEGRITLTAPELFGREKLMPVVEDFLAMHPGVATRVLLVNRVVNLTEEGIDAALRLADLPDSGLTAVGLGAMRRLVCAAPAYLAALGQPARPEDLRTHRCLGAEGTEHELWHFTERNPARSRPITVALEPRLVLNSARASIDAAVRGHGVCRAMAYQVVEHLAHGRLVPVLAAFEPPPNPVHLVFHPIPRRNAALRAFVDHAVPRLRAAVAAVSIAMESVHAALHPSSATEARS
ncbi:hypothetical protein ASF27_14925 [Methylobacterium sp. Leaf102]|uniref:LysR family transcriptional regulator n=1 Tax=Methylobacterium sp. Leaf102 TaxID=1736253 RepID=UPI000701A6CC|nr:LysR family transcriptional regulator [Methylobacterium sp. Leaf102]KQP21861.1 hypothetical protein ASF27_14925 [Methylobacterium sp. Leaf102]